MLKHVTTRVVRSRAAGAPTVTRNYHDRVVDHYENPRNVSLFDKNDSNVGTGLVGAPACDDVMKFQIRVDDKTWKIIDACFKTFGCGSTIAASSLGNAKHLSLSPVKLHCSMLAEDATKAGVKDYESKCAKLNCTQETNLVEKAAEA